MTTREEEVVETMEGWCHERETQPRQVFVRTWREDGRWWAQHSDHEGMLIDGDTPEQARLRLINNLAGALRLEDTRRSITPSEDPVVALAAGPDVRVGDWVRFQWSGALRVGVVQYVHQRTEYPTWELDVVTDVGSVRHSAILEVRRDATPFDLASLADRVARQP